MKLVCDLSVTSHPPRKTPTLSLDFERQVYRRFGSPVDLSSVLHLTRNSPAYRIGETGTLESVGANTIRRDHVYGTGSFKGALFEPEATNLLHYSNDFMAQYWSGYWYKPVFAAGHTAPDGTPTAMTWNCADTTAGPDGARGGLLVRDSTPAGESTVSIWLRATAPVAMRFGHSDQSSRIINISTEWKRFSHTGDLPNSQGRIFILSETTNEDIDVYIWGAQVEFGATATSNITSEGGVAVRGSDMAGIFGIHGTFNVTVIYDDSSRDIFRLQTISDGWWPAMTRKHVKRILIE